MEQLQVVGMGWKLPVDTLLLIADDHKEQVDKARCHQQDKLPSTVQLGKEHCHCKAEASMAEQQLTDNLIASLPDHLYELDTLAVLQQVDEFVKWSQRGLKIDFS